MSHSNSVFQGHPVLHLQEQQASGVQGGTFTAGAWQKRSLNTVVENTIAGASAVSGAFILPAGRYRFVSWACAHYVNSHRAQLYDITGAASLLYGLTLYSENGYGGNEPANMRGRFELAVTSTIELQHRCSSTKNTDGLGSAGAFGTPEIYSDAYIERISP